MSKILSPKVAIVDFGMGNLFSIKRVCEQIGFNCVITHDKDEVLNAQGLILPGVGAFGDAMEQLRNFDLIGPLKDFISSGHPFLGICLGMQLLLTESEEFGRHRGLDILSGSVKRFPSQNQKGETMKVPQVGWNQIFPPQASQENFPKESVLRNVPRGEYMYFVHSYCVCPTDPSVVASVTHYEDFEYCSSLEKGNIFAVQFHPEKSAGKGIQIYANWSEAVLGSRV